MRRGVSGTSHDGLGCLPTHSSGLFGYFRPTLWAICWRRSLEGIRSDLPGVEENLELGLDALRGWLGEGAFLVRLTPEGLSRRATGRDPSGTLLNYLEKKFGAYASEQGCPSGHR